MYTLEFIDSTGLNYIMFAHNTLWRGFKSRQHEVVFVVILVPQNNKVPSCSSSSSSSSKQHYYVQT